MTRTRRGDQQLRSYLKKAQILFRGKYFGEFFQLYNTYLISIVIVYFEIDVENTLNIQYCNIENK